MTKEKKIRCEKALVCEFECQYKHPFVPQSIAYAIGAWCTYKKCRVDFCEPKEMSKSDEALLILQEECAEVIYIANKALRFGLQDIHPETGVVNREALAQEMGHVIAMVDILVEQKIITENEIRAGKAHKLEKLKKWSSLLSGNEIKDES